MRKGRIHDGRFVLCPLYFAYHQSSIFYRVAIFNRDQHTLGYRLSREREFYGALGRLGCGLGK